MVNKDAHRLAFFFYVDDGYPETWTNKKGNLLSSGKKVACAISLFICSCKITFL